MLVDWPKMRVKCRIVTGFMVFMVRRLSDHVLILDVFSWVTLVSMVTMLVEFVYGVVMR